ncbi:hypothetical protein [Maricaulis salignorans]|nr:hypothetical protein [Maricaulis salignorans]
MTLIAALLAQGAGPAAPEHGAIFPEGRFVERDDDGALQCEDGDAAFITIRVRQVRRLDFLAAAIYEASAGLVSFNLDADPEPQPLYAIHEAEMPARHGVAGEALIGAARITTAGRYEDDVFDGSTTGALSLTLRQYEDGDIEILELWENDRRGLHSAAAPDRSIVTAGPAERGVLISTGRVLRQFGPCPAPQK